MRLADGRELLAQLAHPLPLAIAPELMTAIGKAAEKAGYTDVGILTAGPHAGYIVATPPAPRTRRPARRRQCTGCARAGGELTENGCPSCGPKAEIR